MYVHVSMWKIEVIHVVDDEKKNTERRKERKEKGFWTEKDHTHDNMKENATVEDDGNRND